MDGQREGLHRLEPFFAVRLDGAPERAVDAVQPVRAFRDELWSEERRVTFCGAFKAGKSSLLNALVGAPLLPARAQRATGTVTTIRYGDVPRVTVYRNGPEGPWEDEVPFDSAAASILLNLSHRSDLEAEVRIAVPLPLLRGGGVLIDTPGLLDDGALEARARAEIERADLAVMVLSADKILSSGEREVARSANALLRGNVVFAVNRLDTIEEDDREDVLGWVMDALRECGNALTGRPRVFATAARGDVGGVDALRAWLESMLTSPLGERIATLSRLGRLDALLESSGMELRAGLETAEEEVRQAREAEDAALARIRAAMRTQIATSRTRLAVARERLPELGEAFVTGCVEATRPAIEDALVSPGPIPIRYEAARDSYAASIGEAAREALLDAPVTAPDFSLRGWILRVNVDGASHPVGELGVTLGDLATRMVDGGSAGRKAGASIGAWFGKKVLNVDLEAETVKRIERTVRGTLPALEAEATAYLARVVALLAEAEAYYESWRRATPEIDAAEARARYYRGLVQWCSGFRGEVESAMREVAGEGDFGG